MEREIKFRGQKTSTNEWVYGSLIIDTQNSHDVICQQCPNPVNNGELRGWCFAVKNVGQYTGLKDKNGTEIYEGDVLRTFPILASDKIGDDSFNVSVFWGESGWIANGLLNEYHSKISEVIGNIWENPELLNK